MGWGGGWWGLVGGEDCDVSGMEMHVEGCVRGVRLGVVVVMVIIVMIIVIGKRLQSMNQCMLLNLG